MELRGIIGIAAAMSAALVFGLLAMGCGSAPSAASPSSASPPSTGSGTIRNRSTGTTVSQQENRFGKYYQLDGATRFYTSLTEEGEQALALTYLMDDNGDVAALNAASNPGPYRSLISIYEQDDKDWGLNINSKPGTFYLTEIGNDSVRYYGIVLNFRWLESKEESYFMVKR
jgi:hypothetical protein